VMTGHLPRTSTTALVMRITVCPLCRGPLGWSHDHGDCRVCGARYDIVDGIPILLPDKSLGVHDELDHSLRTAHKHEQSNYFDRQLATEFEIARPHGTPPLYQWLIAEKFRRSMVGIHPLTVGTVVLAVCAGSGMDAEYLARGGASVVASDISLGAARRCLERACRQGLDITPIVADVERLPFPDRSIELVYVHDGLHHLQDPHIGLAEMARVAAGALSMTEPAAASLTKLAIGLGIAQEREEAGNRVARLRIADATRILAINGLRTVSASRYLMYYPHQPGRIFRFLSAHPMLSAAKLGFAISNRLLGRLGNKLSVQAVRTNV
jgi:uncharacterized protein YbaR (Trm112 family)